MEYKAYSFDLDDNLLKLPTCVSLRDKSNNIQEFSTLEFEKIRPNLEKLNLYITKNSFKQFSDDNQFIIDINKATKCGSWRNLEKCIIKHTSIFAIITARGHSIETIKAGINIAIFKNISKENLEIFRLNFLEKYNIKLKDTSLKNVMSEYLNLCKFYPVNNKEIKKEFGSNDISELKSLCFQEFRNYILKYVKDNFEKDMKVKIGFSDDSTSHLDRMVHDALKKHGLFFYKSDKTGKTRY